jgi:CHAD domain-containing protein
MGKITLNAKAQSKYIQNLWDKMTGHMLAFYDAQQPEDIHQFRVSVKKIRSVAALLQGAKRMKKIKKSRIKLREIFQHAGRLRSIHVHIELLEQYGVIDEAHLQRLKNDLSAETAAFYQLHDKYVKVLTQSKNDFTKGAKDISLKDLRKIYLLYVEELDIFFTNEAADEEQLHEKRKLIKQLLYLDQSLPKKHRKKIGLHTEFLNELQELIGQWHDAVSTIEFLTGSETISQELLEHLKLQKTAMENEIWTKANYFALKAVDDLR